VTQQVQSILAELRVRLEALYGERLVRLVLFGSQARGDAEPGSDIDVLVVLRGDVDPYEEIERSGDAVADLSLDYNACLACSFVSEDDFQGEQSPLMLNVRREGVRL